MQKIRALARRSSGRVVPPPAPTRRASTSGQDARGGSSLSSHQLLLPSQVPPAAPERVARSGSVNALSWLGKKISGIHHHRQRHSRASEKHDGASSAREDRHDRSTDPVVGVYAGRRPRTGEDSCISGGTSLVDMQAFAHPNRTASSTAVGRHDDTPTVVVEGELTPRRRASEIVRDLDSVSGCFLPDSSEGVVTRSTPALVGHVGAAQSKVVKPEGRDAQFYSVKPPPPTPPPTRRSFTSPASPTPRRHKKKRSTSSFTRLTSGKLGRQIINHTDLEVVILLGEYAQRNRGINPSRRRSRVRTHRKSGLPPPPPQCPLAADVFTVEDTVKRNREAAMSALTAKDRQEKKDVGKLVRSKKFMEGLDRAVDFEESPVADADVATVRGWVSKPRPLQVLSPLETADPGATAKCCGKQRNAPAVNSLEFPSEEKSSRRTSSQFWFWGLRPLPPSSQEVPTMRNSTGFRLQPAPSELKRLVKVVVSLTKDTVPPARPWKFKDLEKLPSLEPADRIARIVRWVADVEEAMPLEAVPDAPFTGNTPEHYVPYWHFP
ncbi:hypothetical protein FRC01_013688 [Tulasnella sp. 417]|nr:hypothetical protein FRC01_013688 [Tulasnella sp. 417]